MDYWFQRILLAVKCAFLAVSLAYSNSLFADENNSGDEPKAYDTDKIETEYFDLGFFIGTINIEDFTSEIVTGVNLTFNASEDFFMQVNYLQADISLSSFELSQGQLFSGSDREFNHLDFLAGYNLFQGEHFILDDKASLSTLYLVAGVGNTDFGGEGSFTYTLGIGYQIAIQRNILLRLDYRDYIYKTIIIGENNSVNNTQLSLGVSYLF